MRALSYLAIFSLFLGCSDGGSGTKQPPPGAPRPDASSPSPASGDLAQSPAPPPDLAAPGPGPGPGGGDLATGGMADMAMGGGGNCKYPDGPYDSKEGGTLDPTLAYTCLRPGETSGAGTMMTVKDFFDCDGSRKINALLFDVSGTYCAGCQDEADELEGKYEKEMWGPRGIVEVTLLLKGDDAVKTTVIQDAINWVAKHKLVHMYTCIGPKDSAIMTGTTIPFNIGVDPRKMKVESTGMFPDLVAMAKKNGAM